MKFSVTSYNAVAVWKWDTHPNPADHKLYHYAKSAATGETGAYDDDDDDDEDEDDDVCGICRLAFESTCPECKIPGDDCPLIWGECTHVFHMHCLLKWIDTESSKGQCPMDRRPWATADRAPDQLPTTTSGEPVATIVPGPLPEELLNSSASQPAPAALGAPNGDVNAEISDEGADDDDDEEDIEEDEDADDGMDVDEVEQPSTLRV